jgi:hypothetical protein
MLRSFGNIQINRKIKIKQKIKIRKKIHKVGAPVHVIYPAIGFHDTVMDKTHFLIPNAEVFLRNIQNNRKISIKNMPVRRPVLSWQKLHCIKCSECVKLQTSSNSYKMNILHNDLYRSYLTAC